MIPKSRNFFILRIPYWIVVPILLALIELVGFAADGFQVAGDTISDSDSLMRLAYLKQVWATGHWQQGFFDRNNAPYGMVLHWTLPFNLFILGLAKSLFFLNPDQALQYAGYWTGPIFCFAVAGAAYGAGRQILSPIAASFAAGLMTFSPFLFNYADRGEANHHALLYLDTIAMTGFAFAAARRRNNKVVALLGGAMAAFCLWCSFELVLLSGAYFAFLFCLWVKEGESRLKQVLLSAGAFVGATGFALLVDPPYGGYGVIVFDHISLAFVVLASLPLVVGLAAMPFRFTGWVQRLVFLTIAGSVTAGLWLLCFPSALGGVQGAMDPYVAQEWLTSINEVHPLKGWREIVLYLGAGALCLPLIPVVTRNNGLRVAWLAILLGVGVMADRHYRFAGYSIIAAGFFLAYAFDCTRTSTRRRVRVIARTLAIMLFAGFFGAEVFSNVLGMDIEHPAEEDDGYNCDPYDVKDQLNDPAFLGDKETAIVADDINATPMLLYWTRLRTLAGNYHRDSQGIKDSYLFFRDLEDDTAQRIAKKRGIDFVLVCASGNNLGYSFTSQAKAVKEDAKKDNDYAPDPTLYTRLTDQIPPDWLELVPWLDNVDSDLLLYRVKK
jgi:hypothetical protein